MASLPAPRSTRKNLLQAKIFKVYRACKHPNHSFRAGRVGLPGIEGFQIAVFAAYLMSQCNAGHMVGRNANI
jgi:hypothetical protein